jgi:hypothetical protein
MDRVIWLGIFLCIEGCIQHTNGDINMPWNIDLVTMVRSLIGDMSSLNYSDNRLRQVIAIAAFEVNNSTGIEKNYEINISKVSISPDPIEEKDINFSVMTAYKAAVLVLQGEVRNQSLNSISINDGTSSINLTDVTRSLQSLYKDLSTRYEDLLNTYIMEESSLNGQAILGPYSPGGDLINWQYHSDYRANNL